jgi:hypothetical protein
MKKIIQLKYVPVCVCSLHRLVEMAMNGKPVLDTDWTGAGRPPLATIDEKKSIAKNMEYQSGRTILPDDISKILLDWQMMKIKDAGFVSLDSPKFSSSTKRNYFAMIGNQSNISVSQTSIIKTTTRFAAENSIRRCISNLALIGSTHFFSVQNEDSNIRAEIKTLPESTKMFLDMVLAAWGTSVCPVLPELIVSTDNTTEYIFEGTKDD